MSRSEVIEIKEESRGARQRESDRKRRRILEAARGSFGELGFAKATIETISAAAGVSNGLLYQFFRNKEHLFEVVIDELVRDWVRAMVGGDASRSPSERLAAMFRGSVDFARNHPLLPALLTEDAILQLSRFSEKTSHRVEAHREHVAGILRDGIECGEFRNDLDVAAFADIICQLQADYSGRAYRRKPEYPSDPELIEAAIRFVDRALRA